MKQIMSYKTLPILILFGCTIFNQEVQAQQDYTVKGKIEGWPTKYIILESRGNYPSIDSVENKDGSFEFKGKIQGPTNAFLVARTEGTPSYKFFFLEPGNTEINGAFENYEKSQIKGSASTELYYNIRSKHEQISNQIDSLYSLLNTEADSTKSAAIQKEIASQEANDIKISKEFISTNTTSPVTVYELSGLGLKLDYPELKRLYDLLDPKVKQSVQAEELTQYVQNLGNIEVGKIAPAIAQNDTAGNVIKLQDFRGKYVLIDFWASWCIPCRRENPNMLAAYKTYKDKGFEILGVSIDSKSEEWRWKRAINNDGIIWPQISDLKGNKNEAAVTYAVQMIPTNFLIDPDGKIIAKNLVGEKLQEKLKEIFQK